MMMGSSLERDDNWFVSGRREGCVVACLLSTLCLQRTAKARDVGLRRRRPCVCTRDGELRRVSALLSDDSECSD